MKFLVLILSFYLFLLSLAPNMKGVELLKIGHLMDHYELHQERNSDATLLSFIKEHYFNSSIDFEKEHQEMPFKVSTSFLISMFIENKETIQFHLFSLSENNRSSQPLGFQSSYFFNTSYSIWNPPRM